MAIALLGKATSTATTVTLPAGIAAGDVILLFGFASTQANPAIPTGYTSVFTQAASGIGFRLAYKIATGSEGGTTTPAMTSSKATIAQVYRGVSAVGGASSGITADTSNAIIPGIGSMQVTDGTSWAVSFGGSNNFSGQSTPAGTTLRASSSNAGSSVSIIGFDSNGGVASWGQHTSSDSSAASAGGGGSVELKAAVVSSTTLVNETMAAAPTTGTFVTSNLSNGWNSGGYFVTNNNVNQYGDYEYTGAIPSPFTASAQFAMSTTSGADGQWFYYGWSSSPQTESDAGGYLINRNDFGNSIEIRFNGSTLTSVSYTKDTNYDTFTVDVTGQSFTVTYNNVIILQYTDATTRTLPGSKYGWGSRSGGTANTHSMKNLLLTTTGSGGTPPPTYPGQFFAFF